MLSMLLVLDKHLPTHRLSYNIVNVDFSRGFPLYQGHEIQTKNEIYQM